MDKDTGLKLDFTRFVSNLQQFISDIHRYVPNKGCEKFLEVFTKLDMNRILIKYLNTMRDVEDKLNAKDESIFSSKLVVVPGVDLNELWPQLKSGQKRKVWTYLQILFVHAELIAKCTTQGSTESTQQSKKDLLINNIYEGVKEQVEQENKTEEGEEKKEVFNPYIGIGTDGSDYTVEDIVAGKDSLPEDGPARPGLGSLMNTLGLDKMLNIDELKEQLQNMSKDDIEEATKNIKGLFGDNIDDAGTTNLINSMLTSIQDELKNNDLSEGNPFDNIMKVAESVATKIKPQMKDEDAQKIFASTQNLANKYQIDGDNANPFDMMNQLLGQSGNNPQQLMQNCNSMLQQMGIDPSAIQNPNSNQRKTPKNKNKNRRRR